MNKQELHSVDDLKEGKLYKIGELQGLLKSLGLLYSIYTIRDYETWKCLDYHCGKRHNSPVAKCERCGKDVRAPLIISPRTRGGGKGPGHRRYTAGEIRQIVTILSERR